MADVLISDLTADTSPTSDDLMETLNDPAGTPASKKVTLGNAITKAHGLSDSTVVGVASGVLTSGTDVAVADGGTGASTASNARTNLGLAIGTDVQAYDADLTALAGDFTSPTTTVAAKLAFREGTDNGTNKITVAGVASVSSDKTLTLPDATDTLVGKATTDTFTNKTIDANGTGNSISNLEVADFATGVVDTDLSSVSASDDTLASAKAIKSALDGKQALDSDLTTIAGLTATTNNMIQSVSSAWASRTPTQVTATLDAMVGDSGSGGTKGLVPAPSAGDSGKYLKGDGTWGTVSGSGDMVLADVQSVIGLKTFDKDKMAMKGTSTGVTTISTANTSASNYTITMPAATTTLVGTDTTDTLSNKTFTAPALGTPASGTLTNCTSLPIAGLTASTSTAIGVGSIELGHASDTTITRTGAGAIAVEGTAVLLSGGALGTPSSGTLTNATGLPIAGLTASTSTALGVGSIELGHASDTTIARVSAGVASIEGVNILTVAGGTLTGNITLGENTSIALNPAGSADGKYSGITVTGTGGATIAFGDLVTLDKDDSRWELVDISVAAAATGDARGVIGVAVTSSTDGNPITVLLQGIVRADANFPALTIGAAVYASTTGDIVVTQPTTTDHVIRIVGHAMTADEIYFNPSPTWITHT